MDELSLDCELFFFYGTLRRGQYNHAAFLLDEPGAKFIGEGWSLEKFALYGAGIPYVFRSPELSRIRGEVYQISDAQVRQKIDKLEGHVDGRKKGYHRELADIEIDDNTLLKAWLYFYYGNVQAELFPSGDWLKRM